MVFLPPANMRVFSSLVANVGPLYMEIEIVCHIALTIAVARGPYHDIVSMYLTLTLTVLAAVVNTVTITTINVGIYGLVFFIVLALQIVTVFYFVGLHQICNEPLRA
ncbi:hypothetical protein QR680_007965 [Steinernema hermaphroditum]|uniref:Uncharacterized protein n=1 Tax=Steinernema hermaphroditum TaxID=289476 RepID=A0AA39IG96_9BILA|nr:hypothetical protein QR680_007965 [Steinernema hermaphroditum]